MFCCNCFKAEIIHSNEKYYPVLIYNINIQLYNNKFKLCCLYNFIQIYKYTMFNDSKFDNTLNWLLKKDYNNNIINYNTEQFIYNNELLILYKHDNIPELFYINDIIQNKNIEYFGGQYQIKKLTFNNINISKITIADIINENKKLKNKIKELN